MTTRLSFLAQKIIKIKNFKAHIGFILIHRSESKIKKMILIREVYQYLSFFFDFWFSCANHFIFNSDSFWFAIQSNFNHFDSIHFDSSWIMIHLRIKNQIESKIKDWWIVIYWLPCVWLIMIIDYVHKIWFDNPKTVTIKVRYSGCFFCYLIRTGKGKSFLRKWHVKAWKIRLN